MIEKADDSNPLAAEINPASGITDKSKAAKHFLKATVWGTLGLLFLSVALHGLIDIYGLFLPVKGKKLPVYHQERISKYLLAHHYIPENYNTIILGTSLSDNLDITSHNEKFGPYRIYNASIMGGNISEIRSVAGKAIQGGIRNVIFCFSPYQLKNSGAKEVELDVKLQLGAMGSKNLYETYAVAIIRWSGLMPKKFPKQQINEHGVNHFASQFRVEDVKERIFRVAQIHRGKPLVIDPSALQELKEVIQLLKDNKVNFLGYFHPFPKEIFECQKEEHLKFQRMIRGLIHDDRRMLDFNDPSFSQFTSDYNNYIDNGHLSEVGEFFVREHLLQKFENLNKGN
jgi:hypothetical protein